MSTSRQVRRCQSIVDLEDRLLHRNLLDDATRQLEVVRGDDEDSLLGNILLREAVLKQEVSNVGHHADAEGLLARHESEAPREVLDHEVSRRAHLFFISFHRKVLHRQFTRRDSSDCDGSFDDRCNDFTNGTIDGDKDESFEGVVACEEGYLRVEGDVVGKRLESGGDGICKERRY